MKQIKRWAAFVMTWMVLLTTGYSDVFAVSLTTEITDQNEDTEVVDTDQNEDTEVVDTDQNEDTKVADADQSADTKAAVTEESTAKVNYLVVESPMVQTPGTQRIMLGIGDGIQTIDAAELSLYNRKTKETSTVKAAEISGDFVLFTMDYADDIEAGVYQLDHITYICEGSSYTAAFRDHRSLR